MKRALLALTLLAPLRPAHACGGPRRIPTYQVGCRPDASLASTPLDLDGDGKKTDLAVQTPNFVAIWLMTGSCGREVGAMRPDGDLKTLPAVHGGLHDLADDEMTWRFDGVVYHIDRTWAPDDADPTNFVPAISDDGKTVALPLSSEEIGFFKVGDEKPRSRTPAQAAAKQLAGYHSNDFNERSQARFDSLGDGTPAISISAMLGLRTIGLLATSSSAPVTSGAGFIASPTIAYVPLIHDDGTTDWKVMALHLDGPQLPALPPIAPIRSVTATSTLAGSAHYRYDAAQVLFPVMKGGAVASAWCEGKPDEGIGEALTINFANPVDLYEVQVDGGVWMTPALHTANNQPTKLHVTWNGENEMDIDVPDGLLAAGVEIGDMGPEPVRTIEIRLDEVKKGKMNDSCISLVDLEGPLPLEAAQAVALPAALQGIAATHPPTVWTPDSGSPALQLTRVDAATLVIAFPPAGGKRDRWTLAWKNGAWQLATAEVVPAPPSP
jgi:hypothetical protein